MNSEGNYLGSDRGNRGPPRRGRDLQYALSGDEERPYFSSDDRLDFFFFSDLDRKSVV